MAPRANQPTYDFLAGEHQDPGQPLRETITKQSLASRPARDVMEAEEVRVKLRTLQYELDTIKQERELHHLQHQQELREAQSRAEADFKRAQAAELAANVATKKAEALSRNTQEERDRQANEKLQLEQKVRSLQDDNRALRDDLEEAKADLEGAGRQNQYAFSELEQKYNALQASFEDAQQDLSGKVTALQAAQQKLVQKETEVGELENEVLRLKAQTGDSDTLAVIKKELTEQVTYIKKLEQTNREHLTELKQIRKTSKSIDVVEEEKRALEAKVRMMDDMRKELAEAQLQKRILEDEKTSWTSYLDMEAAENEDLRYETPEQMARAFLQERLERLDLLNKLGSIQPELLVKEENIRILQDEKTRLQSALEEARDAVAAAGANAGSGDAKTMISRLERQKNLLTKEVEYLRAQLKTFEAEHAEFSPEQVDEAHAKRIHDLEEVLAQYQTEVQTLQTELSKQLEKLEKQPSIPCTPKKRSREEDDASNERLGELQRKVRTLQTDLEKLQKRNQLLEAELKASVSQVKSLKESSRTRVLEFRNNPTAEVEAIKMSTLNTLRDENAALLAQLEGQPHGTKVVPASSLENVRLQLEETKAQMKKMEKKDMRLRQIYSAKALEFREAVCSILGWKLDFMPNGRVKCTSILYPTQYCDGEEVENSIVFDGENGTMKVSGGPQSVFAGEIKEMIEFWVEGRKEIPCFLAALTLEFYDKTTRAMKI